MVVEAGKGDVKGSSKDDGGSCRERAEGIMGMG